MRVVLIIALWLCTIVAYSQQKIYQSPEPSWVKIHDYPLALSDTAGATGGYAYLLISSQINVQTEERYFRYVIKVTSEEGLSYVSSINESFDPAYQRLTFHSLYVVRDGKTIDRLDTEKFDVIRREEEMSRAIYDKTLSAIYNMPDVRVGDVVEYSLTRRGNNPAFGKHAMGGFSLRYSMPVARYAYSITAPTDRVIQFKSFETSETFSVTKSGSDNRYELVVDNVSGLVRDSDLPSWYDPYAYIQYSDFGSWNDLKLWMNELYDLKISSPSLNKLVEEIKKKHTTKESRIKACIRVAQADVRYLSFSDGIHGYKPHSPESVFDQKYGDCKDKSYLLSYLLRQMDVESYPALVSTEIGKVLDDMLPSPYVFDHCITNFALNDSTFWIDPTMNAQVGPLKKYYFPSYHRALVINSRNNGLDGIPLGNHNSAVDILEEYDVPVIGGPVLLKVTTTYTGEEANDTRSYQRNNNRDEIKKDYLNFYAKDYSNISMKKHVEFVDDTAKNVLVSKEEYEVGNFWTEDQEYNNVAYLYARELASYLKNPSTKIRTMPLGISHPRNIRQTIKVYLPESWSIPYESKTIESDGFKLDYESFHQDRVVTVQYKYVSKAGFVSGESSKEHLQKIEEARNQMYYTVYEHPGTTFRRPSVSIVIVLALSAIIGIYIYIARRA